MFPISNSFSTLFENDDFFWILDSSSSLFVVFFFFSLFETERDDNTTGVVVVVVVVVSTGSLCLAPFYERERERAHDAVSKSLLTKSL